MVSIDTTRLAYNQREDVYFSREIGRLFITIIMLCPLHTTVVVATCRSPLFRTGMSERLHLRYGTANVTLRNGRVS